MRSLELPPDKQNLLDSIKQNPLGRNAFLREFLSFLASIEDPCAVALDAAWGSGKTFFVKSAKLILEYLNPQIESDFTIDSFDIPNAKKILPVYYDAWANDNADDPFLSLIHAIASEEHINRTDYFKTQAPFLKKAAAFTDAITGSGIKDLYELKDPEDLLETIKNGNDIDTRICNFLKSCRETVADRIVVFIDELDRCRPSFAVQLLERIKHYFHVDNVIFVLAVNSEQLVHTVRAFYGQDFDANRYLDRFFDFRVGLPPADVNAYLNVLQYQNAAQTEQIYSVEIVRALTEQYRLSLREVEKLCRALKTAGGNPDTRRKFADKKDKGRKAFCYYVLLPVIYTLKMTNLEQYNQFIEGRDPQPLCDIFNNKNNNQAAATYISEFTAADKKLNNADSLVEGYKEIFNEPKCREIRNDLLNLVNLLSPFACYHNEP